MQVAGTWATKVGAGNGGKDGASGGEEGGAGGESSEGDRTESDVEEKQVMAECELEARAQLEEFGITEQHLQAASSRRSRSSIAGIYQVSPVCLYWY